MRVEQILIELEKNTLTSLSFEKNVIDAEGAKAIAMALEKNTSLILLDLSCNQICAEGAKAIAVALEKNTSLILLDLSCNQISAEGAKALAAALKKNTSLILLNLSCNQISDKGAKDLAVALATNTSLTSLDLWGNRISAEGAQALAVALEKNTTLTSLNIDAEWLDKIKKLMARNKSYAEKTLTLNEMIHCEAPDLNQIEEQYAALLSATTTLLDEYPHHLLSNGNVEINLLSRGMLEEQNGLSACWEYLANTPFTIKKNQVLADTLLANAIMGSHEAQRTKSHYRYALWLMRHQFNLADKNRSGIYKLIANILCRLKDEKPTDDFKAAAGADQIMTYDALRQLANQALSQLKKTVDTSHRIAYMNALLERKEYDPAIARRLLDLLAYTGHLNKTTVLLEDILLDPKNHYISPMNLIASLNHDKNEIAKIITLQNKLTAQCNDAIKKLDAIIKDPHASATDKSKAEEIRECVVLAKTDPSNSENIDKLAAYAKEAQHASSTKWKKVGIALLTIAVTCIAIASILLALPTLGTSIAAGVVGGLGIVAAVSGTGLFKKGSASYMDSVAKIARAIEEKTRLGKPSPRVA